MAAHTPQNLSISWRRAAGLLPATPRTPGDETQACAATRSSYAQLRSELLSDPRETDDDLATNNPLCANPDSGWARFFKNEARSSLRSMWGTRTELLAGREYHPILWAPTTAISASLSPVLTPTALPCCPGIITHSWSRPGASLSRRPVLQRCASAAVSSPGVDGVRPAPPASGIQTRHARSGCRAVQHLVQRCVWHTSRGGAGAVHFVHRGPGCVLSPADSLLCFETRARLNRWYRL